MISLAAGALDAALALALWTGVGCAAIPRLLPGRSLLMAPAVGYALLMPLLLPLVTLIGMTRPAVGALLAVIFLLAVALALPRRSAWRFPDRDLVLALALAAMLALGPALVVVPKIGPAGVQFAWQMFDHAKIALIDEIARSGLPVTNPFAAPIGTNDRLAYYYLWHFAAALAARVTGGRGWEADMALTWVTAFASLALMMGIARDWSRTNRAVFWVLLLSLAVSARPFLTSFVWGYDFGDWITGYPGLQTWFCQASWVPQHLAAADCLCVTVLLAARWAQGGGWRNAVGPSLALSLSVAAGFESSTYIGGVLLAACVPLLAPTLIAGGEKADRAPRLLLAGLAAGLTLLLIAPFLRDQAATLTARGVTHPIGFFPFEVFGPKVAPGIRAWLDLPGYWLVQLPVDAPAVYLLGLCGLLSRPLRRWPLETRLFAILVGVGLLIAWLFISTIANNDLGWRAFLPAVMGLTLVTAEFLTRADWRRPALWLALMPVGLGVYGGVSYFNENLHGDARRVDASFAGSEALWQAVRAEAGITERIANNPLAFAHMLPWPDNLSWALLADRRSCFAGRELAMAYVALPSARIAAIEQRFIQLFAGDADADAARSLAGEFGCDVIVLTAADGAWTKDPFTREAGYRLVAEQQGRWRIYRATWPRASAGGDAQEGGDDPRPRAQAAPQ